MTLKISLARASS